MTVYSRYRAVKDWRTVSEFDFTKYDSNDTRRCNDDFAAFITSGLLRCTESTMPDTETRVALAEKFTEEFFSRFGQHMDSVNLYHLSNLCMLDFIKDMQYNKTAKQENGFLSPRQLYTRSKRELSRDTKVIDYHSTRRVHKRIIAKQRNTKPININD